MQNENIKILIVEDDPSFVSILRQRFEDEGFSVFLGRTGQEGLFAFEEANPALVISDVLLPVMSGIEMAKEIRKKNPEVKIIFLTNIKESGYLEEASKLENVEYLIKSDVSLDEVIHSVLVALRLKNN